MRRNAADLRVRLVKVVGRHADKDDGLALRQVEGQLGELGLFNERDAVLGQQIVDHASVLRADEDAQNTQDAGGQAQVEPDAISMAGTRARSGADEHLVPGQVRHQFVDKGKNRGSASINEALAPDFDHVGLGQDLDGRILIQLRQPGLVREASLDEGFAQQGQELVLHTVSVKRTCGTLPVTPPTYGSRISCKV